MTHESMFGAARWIGCGAETATPYIRARFQAMDDPRGKIRICGLGYFELYINGVRVSDDLFVPVTSDYVKRDILLENGQPFDEEMDHRCYVVEYDVSGLVKKGENDLAVALGPGFFATDLWTYGRNVHYGDVRLCYRLELEGAHGEKAEVLSGQDARWSQGNVKESQFFCGEVHDMRLHGEDWTTADFDQWQPVCLLENMDTEYQLQDCPPDRIIRHLTPRLIAEYSGQRIYDAGENVTGWVVLQDEGNAGDKVQVEFSEELQHGNVLDQYYRHDQFFEAVSDGKGRLLHPRFTWNAFRYFTVRGSAVPVSVAVIHADLPRKSAFESSSKVLNWIYNTFIHTMLCNAHGGIPSDCPHLERRGYTGDGQLTCEAALLTLNHHDFIRKWMRDIADCQDRHSGHVQYTAPYSHCGGGPGGWGIAIIMVPYQYYRHYGDAQPLRDMYAGMCEYIRYLQEHSENHLVVSDRPGEWCLGDWCCPGGVKLPPPFVNTYFMVRALDMLCEIEVIIGAEKQSCWQEERKLAVDALIAHYYDDQTSDFVGNIQGANAFMLDIGLGDERTLENLIRHYQQLGAYDTGIFGTEIVSRMLCEKGAYATAYQLLTSEADVGFAGWMKAGATTLWEYYRGDHQRSLNHPMFGAVTASIMHYALGIRQEKGSAGWKKTLIAPCMIRQLPSVSGFVETPQGDVKMSYLCTGERVRWHVEVPHGMEIVFRAGRVEKMLAGGSYDFTTGYQEVLV